MERFVSHLMDFLESLHLSIFLKKFQASVKTDKNSGPDIFDHISFIANLEWQMFPSKFVEEIKPRFMSINLFSPKIVAF